MVIRKLNSGVDSMCCCGINMKMLACQHVEQICHLAKERYLILIMMCHVLHVFINCCHMFCSLLRSFVVHLFLRRSGSFKCFKFRRKDRWHFFTWVIFFIVWWKCSVGQSKLYTIHGCKAICRMVHEYWITWNHRLCLLKI